MTRCLVIAHRGHSAGAPELTAVAFSAARNVGADLIEADVRRTRDGSLVLLHDATVDRTTNGSGCVRDLTWAQVRSLDAGSWFAPRFARQRVPAMDELLELAEESGMALCLEVKGETRDERRCIAEAVARRLETVGRLGTDFVASFDHETLSWTRDSFGGVRIAPERLPERGPSSADEAVSQAAALRTSVLQHHHADLDRSVVSALHSAGVAIWAWPTTTAKEIAEALSLGVDACMGADVALARRLIDEAQAESPAI